MFYSIMSNFPKVPGACHAGCIRLASPNRRHLENSPS